MTSQQGTKWWLLAALAFASEIALLIAAGVAAKRLSEPRSWALAASWGAVVIVGAIWMRWMSPNSAHRLPEAGRVLLACSLFITVGLTLGLTGGPWGPLLAIAGCAVTVVVQPALGQQRLGFTS